MDEEKGRGFGWGSFSKPRIYRNTSWGVPQSVVGISGYNSECRPSLTKDGKYMYFIASITNGPPYDTIHYGTGFNVYVAKWNGTSWDSVRNVGSNVNPASYACISPDGNKLFVTKGKKIFVSTKTATGWTRAEALPSPINDSLVESRAPFVRQLGGDTFELYFASKRDGGYGGWDIWVARWNGEEWDSLTNLGPAVNTAGGESHPSLSPDGKLLYFTDFGGPRNQWKFGDADLYVAEWQDTCWGEAMLVDAPVNTDLPLCSSFPSVDGKLYVASEVSEGGFGEEDIWVVDTFGMKRRMLKGSEWVNTGELDGAWYVYCLLQTQDGTIYAGTAPNGDVFKSIDQGSTWVNTGELDGATHVYSLIEASDGTLYAGTYPNGDVFKSEDGGLSWSSTQNLPNVKAVRALLETQDGAIIAGTSPDSSKNGRLFKTTNRGASWQPLVIPRTPHGYVNSGIFALFETEDGVLFAGGRTMGDVFFVSTDQGGSWRTVNLPYPDEEVTVGHIYFFKKFNNTIWMGGWAHGPQGILLKSEDNGVTWDTIPQIRRNSIIVARIFDITFVSGDSYIIGTHPGVDTVCYISTDGGNTWIPMGPLYEAREVLCLLRAQDGTIYAGTTPNGDVFKYEFAGTEERKSKQSIILLQNVPNPFYSTTAIKYRIAKKEDVFLAIYDLTGRLVRVLVDTEKLPGTYIIKWDGKGATNSRLPSGIYFCKLRVAGSLYIKKLLLM
jgi:photosystem II stability/assembly factor-like uncharacterized protein